MMKFIYTKKLYKDLYISLVIAQLCGRVAAGILKALIFSAGGYSVGVWIMAYFVTSLPGILIQFAIIPAVVALEKARLIPEIYI